MEFKLIVLGFMIGFSLGYIVYSRAKIKYDKEKHILDPRGLDAESVNSLIEFIEECIRREKLENLRGKKK